VIGREGISGTGARSSRDIGPEFAKSLDLPTPELTIVANLPPSRRHHRLATTATRITNQEIVNYEYLRD
jgi:hypothetical protein